MMSWFDRNWRITWLALILACAVAMAVVVVIVR